MLIGLEVLSLAFKFRLNYKAKGKPYGIEF